MFGLNARKRTHGLVGTLPISQIVIIGILTLVMVIPICGCAKTNNVEVDRDALKQLHVQLHALLFANTLHEKYPYPLFLDQD